MERTESAAGRSVGVRTAGALLLAAGVLAVLQATVGSGYTFADDIPEIVMKIEGRSNEGFFTWVVFWAITWGLFAGGVAALARAMSHGGSTVVAGLGVAAATMTAIGATLRIADSAVLSALVNRWPEDTDRITILTGGTAQYIDPKASLDVIDAIRFGLDQTGYGVLGVAMLLLGAAICGARRVLHPMAAIVPLLLGLYWLAGVSDGDGVSPMVIALGGPVLGALVLLAARWRADL